MPIAAIIPAYNEAPRLARVLAAVTAAPSVEEVIVVSDGSTDETCAVAAAWPNVTLVPLPTNTGKSGALAAGVDCTGAEVLLFLDADLLGLTPQHVERLLQPVLSGAADMTVGRFHPSGWVVDGMTELVPPVSGRWARCGAWVTGIPLRMLRVATHWWHYLGPHLSGQRALRRELFTRIPQVDTLRFGIEAALTQQAQRSGARVQIVELRGVTHALKPEKFGWWHALGAAVKECAEVVATPSDAQGQRLRSKRQG